ncbi:MAG: response regulator [Gemmatimonadales bacterium]
MSPTRAKARQPARKRSVLVVDDDEPVRRLSLRILREAGYEVFEARSGWEAIELLREHPDEIDAVITDIVMPGLAGFELIEGGPGRPCPVAQDRCPICRQKPTLRLPPA